MKQEQLNQTSLEAADPAPSDEMLTEFEKSIRFLSDLPTERAMKEIAKMRAVPESVKRVVEIMALTKMDMIKSLRLMHIRERSLEHTIEKYRASAIADKAISEFLKLNPNYDIQLIEK